MLWKETVSSENTKSFEKSQRQISDAIEWDVGETAGEYLESAACGLCARHYTKSLLKYVTSS